MAGKASKQRASLDDYRGKRNLSRSGEPAGGWRRGRRRPRFVVQEHQASSLQYEDFEGSSQRGSTAPAR